MDIASSPLSIAGLLRKTAFCIFVAVLILTHQEDACADLIFDFGQNNYEVGHGSTITVDVYLRQTAGELNVDNFNGITDVGIRVFFNDAPPSDPAVVLSQSDILISDQLNDSGFEMTYLDSGVSAGFEGGVSLSGGSPVLPVNDRIFLGSFTFTAGSVVGEVTNLRTADLFVSNQTIAGDGTILDGLITYSNATITTVPEPSGFLFASLAVMALTTRRSRQD